MTKNLSIVVPVYNEPENIEQTLKRIYELIKIEDKEVIIVYDNDTDTTLPILDAIKHQYRDLKIIKNKIHPGPSGALISGFNEATKELTLVMMADLCDDISKVDKIIYEYSNDYDVISFSRFSEGGEAILNKPKEKFTKAFFKHYLKIILPKVASFFLHTIGGLTIKDPTNSYKIYSTKILKRIQLKSKISFSVTLEIIMKAKAMGYKLYEVPTKWTDREFGKTNFPLLKSIKAYLHWFSILLINNRIFSLSNSFFKNLYLKDE